MRASVRYDLHRKEPILTVRFQWYDALVLLRMMNLYYGNKVLDKSLVEIGSGGREVLP